MQPHSHEVSPQEESPGFWQLRLRSDRRAARRARRWLVEDLGFEPDGAAVLLAHELVTNSVEHSRARHVWLNVLSAPEGIRLEVVDDGGGDPRQRDPEPLATSGRGLRWVETMSDSWGVARRKLTHVWCQLPRRARRG